MYRQGLINKIARKLPKKFKKHVKYGEFRGVDLEGQSIRRLLSFY